LIYVFEFYSDINTHRSTIPTEFVTFKSVQCLYLLYMMLHFERFTTYCVLNTHIS